MIYARGLPSVFDLFLVRLHTSLNPAGVLLGRLGNLLLGQVLLLEGLVRRGHVSALFETRAREEEVPPLLQGRELVDVYAGAGFCFGDESANRDCGHGQRKDGAISLLDRAFEKAYLLQLPIPRRIYLPACTCRRQGSPTWTTATPCPWCGTGGGSRSCTCRWHRGASPAHSLDLCVSQIFYQKNTQYCPCLRLKWLSWPCMGPRPPICQKTCFVPVSMRDSESERYKTHPVVHLPVLSRAVGVGDLVVLVVAVHEVLHDGGALKQPDGLAVLEDVREGRDAAVGVDLEEPWLLPEGNCQ